MRTGCHRVCAVTSPDSDKAVEMASDCHLVRDEGNPACIDGVGLTNDNTSASHKGYLTHLTCCQNRMKNPQRIRPCPMNCLKMTTWPLTLPDVVP